MSVTVYTHAPRPGFQPGGQNGILAAMFNRALTKRQLGWLLLLGGLAAVVAIVAIDVFDAGREGGIGPAQQIALLFSALLALVGLSLLPLGSAPA